MLFALFNPKSEGGVADFGHPTARFEGDDPVSAMEKHIHSEEWDAEQFLESSFESFGKPYTYIALAGMDVGTFTILKVSSDPGTKEFDVQIAELS